MPCRVNRQAAWSLRLRHEASLYPYNTWCTLTYQDSCLPMDGVEKVEMQKIFKRMRFEGLKFRYYCVGEYGETHGRPHYHIIFFGLKITAVEMSKYWIYSGYGIMQANGRDDIGIECDPLDDGLINYTTKYITKYLTKKDDYLKLGLNPEFSLQSRRPALGCIGIEKHARGWSDKGFIYDNKFKVPFPRAYQNYLKKNSEVYHEKLKFKLKGASRLSNMIRKDIDSIRTGDQIKQEHNNIVARRKGGTLL